MNSKIKYLNFDEKPREKIIQKGGKQLSDQELLAIILRSGGLGKSAITLSKDLINKFGNIKNLIEADYEEIAEIKNVGPAKATSIVALHEICLRFLEKSVSEKTVCIIKKPEDIYNLLIKDLYSKKKEELYLVSLDARNKVVSKDLVSVGILSETLVHPREIFKTAIQKNASSIILSHNHPTGNPNPSTNDINTTDRLIKAGIILGIPLLDHIIIAKNSYVSLKMHRGSAWETKGGDY